MPEPRDARSIIEHAEQAAAAGNYSSAEHLLREAAALQEQTLGPNHPDLANTLNNLGVVCEMTDDPIDAEHYFRRAYAIATATLAPDHPFVATSRKNLHDFCVARGRPLELPPSPPQIAAWLDASEARTEPLSTGDRMAEVEPREVSPLANTHDASAVSSKRSFRPLALFAVSGVVMLAVILTMGRHAGSGGEETTSPPATAKPVAPEAPASTPTPPPAEPIAEQPSAATPTPSIRNEGDVVSDEPVALTTSSATPTVVTAQLCTALTAWRCQAAESQTRPGRMYFYTKVKSATATTIEHRWYHGDRLRQAVRLRIEANPGDGYRTYSRNTVNSEGGGDWRVELRSADGAVLHEERFNVSP